MVYLLMIPLVTVGWFVNLFGGNIDRYDYFLDSLEDLLDDYYPDGATRTALGFTAFGFGLAHFFGTNPGPVGEMSLYRGLGALAYIGVVALILCGMLAIGTLSEYFQNSHYVPNENMVGLWLIGFTVGIVGTSTGIGYFIVPWLL